MFVKTPAVTLTPQTPASKGILQDAEIAALVKHSSEVPLAKDYTKIFKKMRQKPMKAMKKKRSKKTGATSVTDKVILLDAQVTPSALRKRIHSRAWRASREKSDCLGLGKGEKAKRAYAAARAALSEYFEE